MIHWFYTNPWIFPVGLIIMAFAGLRKKLTKFRLVDIKYEELSEKRKQAARDRAGKEGFIYLGDVKKVVDDDIFLYMTSKENVVCKVGDDEILFYSIKTKTEFFSGIDTPQKLPDSITAHRISRIQAWYQPGGNYGSFCIELQQFPGFGREYVEGWTSYHSKRSMTDALILLTEKTAPYIKQ